MSRRLPAAALAVACLVAFGVFGSARAEPATVHGSKSKQGDRVGGGGGVRGSASKTTTVKSSKSNTNDRRGPSGNSAPAGVIDTQSRPSY
jgi:hypothetical protein